MGVGLASALLGHGHSFGSGVNWAEVAGVPLVFDLAAWSASSAPPACLLLARRFLASTRSCSGAAQDRRRRRLGAGMLVLTCTGVSFAHGLQRRPEGMASSCSS